MSLSLQAIDRLFSRMSATYGTEFSGKFEGIDPGAVKASWAHELSGFTSRLDCVAWALENLPERCPNVIQFRNLCNAAPSQPVKLLDMPKADPGRVAAELAKLGIVRDRPPVDKKDWARRRQTRDESGEMLKPIQIRFYKEALRLA